MKNVAILMGGDSGEYEVSLKTAHNIFQLLDSTLFTPFLIHIKGADWSYTQDNGEVSQIDKNDFSITISGKKIFFDVVFIAIHGTPGEDGKFQGYFDMLHIPYTACNLFTSALTFNKYYCNLVLSHFNIPISPSIHYFASDVINYSEVEALCGYPCFVKPCNSGSSVGVTKAHNIEELKMAIHNAFLIDNQLMIEKMIVGRELACGVATINGKPTALAITEITSKNEFYDYKSKYSDGLHDLYTPANIGDAEKWVKNLSEQIYHLLDCKGVVRVDFILNTDNNPIFLEINTIPGQTSMSIVPAQINILGMNLTDFYTSVIKDALQQ